MRYIDAEAFERTVMFSADEDLQDVIYRLRDYPTANVRENVKGEWIRRTDTRFGSKLNDLLICSVCGIAFSTEDMIRRSFCPNCGADMRGDGGGEA